EIGSAGLVTTNSERLLDTPVIEMLRQLLFVTTTVAAALFVFTASDPKLTELGARFTCACTDNGKIIEPANNIAIDRHTSSVLFIVGSSFVFFSGATLERRGGGEGAWCSPLDSPLPSLRVGAAVAPNNWL